MLGSILEPTEYNNIPALTILALTSALALCGTLAFAWIKDRAVFKLNFWLSYFGFSTAALYLVSDRLVQFGGFQNRYVVILAVSAAGAMAMLLVRHMRLELRPTCAGAILGFSLALLLSGIPRQSGSLSQWLDTLRFLRSASQFRDNCDVNAFAYEINYWSAVILCKKADLPPGTTIIKDAKIWKSSPEPANVDFRNAPRIFVSE